MTTADEYLNQTFTFAEVSKLLRDAITASTVKDIDSDQSLKGIAEDIIDAIEGKMFNFCDDRDFDAAKGEDQQAIGVQAIPGLTSTPPHGATDSASGTLGTTRGAETVGLSSDVDGMTEAINMINILKASLAGNGTCAYRVLDSASEHLVREQRTMLTGGAL